MEIKYLKKLEDYYNSNPKISKIGVPEQDIEKFEQKFNVKFPKAYKEFLSLAGNRDNILGDWNRGFEHLDWIQENLKESMRNVNLHLKPFFVFAEYGRDQALFFFLNDDDNPLFMLIMKRRLKKTMKIFFILSSGILLVNILKNVLMKI
jgi:hypothetical protein